MNKTEILSCALTDLSDVQLAILNKSTRTSTSKNPVVREFMKSLFDTSTAELEKRTKRPDALDDVIAKALYVEPYRDPKEFELEL